MGVNFKVGAKVRLHPAPRRFMRTRVLGAAAQIAMAPGKLRPILLDQLWFVDAIEPADGVVRVRYMSTDEVLPLAFDMLMDLRSDPGSDGVLLLNVQADLTEAGKWQCTPTDAIGSAFGAWLHENLTQRPAQPAQEKGRIGFHGS